VKLELHNQLFIVIILFGWGLALAAGSRTERLTTAIMIAGAILSVVAVPPLAPAFGSLEIGLAAVDAVMLISFLLLAHRSKEAWLIWMSGLQFLVVLSHFPILLRPLITPEGYVITNALWPWLMMLILIGVTIRSIRSRSARKTRNS
jgi:hypothetical protein